LEKLLERETISHSTLRQLEKGYNLSNGNAEVGIFFPTWFDHYFIYFDVEPPLYFFGAKKI